MADVRYEPGSRGDGAAFDTHARGPGGPVDGSHLRGDEPGSEDRAEDGHGGEFVRRGAGGDNPHLILYRCGRLFNQIRWYREQTVLSGGRGNSARQISLLLMELRTHLRKAFPGARALPLLRHIIALTENWEDALNCEQAAGLLSDAYSVFREAYREIGLGFTFQEAIQEAFSGAFIYLPDPNREFRQAFIDTIGGDELLKKAFFLGECVDRGVRPADCMESNFRKERNWEWARWKKRAGSHRVKKDGRRTRAWPARPLKYRLVARECQPGEVPPAIDWWVDLARSWYELNMPIDLPQALFAVAQRRSSPAVPRIVELVDKTATESFIRLKASRGAIDSAGPRPRIDPSKVVALSQSMSVSVSTQIRQEADMNLTDAVDRSIFQPDQANEADVAQESTAEVAGSSEISDHLPRGSESLQTVTASDLKRMRELKLSIDSNNEYIGESLAILKVFERIDHLNKNLDRPVLILGPTGSGKTEVAMLIHKSSSRKDGPFLREQAADNRMNDLAFLKGRWVGFGEGHGVSQGPTGASTGILQDHAGGTVFVDELVDLSLDFQGFLLDVLDHREIPVTVGKGKPVPANVRLIFATNADLDEAVREGKFRHDLLERIRRRVVRIPPLSERKEDIFSFVAARCGDHKPAL